MVRRGGEAKFFVGGAAACRRGDNAKRQLHSRPTSLRRVSRLRGRLDIFAGNIGEKGLKKKISSWAKYGRCSSLRPLLSRATIRHSLIPARWRKNWPPVHRAELPPRKAYACLRTYTYVRTGARLARFCRKRKVGRPNFWFGGDRRYASRRGTANAKRERYGDICGRRNETNRGLINHRAFRKVGR